MWKDSIRNIVVIFQTNILRTVGFYVRHSANVLVSTSMLFCVFQILSVFGQNFDTLLMRVVLPIGY